MNLLLLLAAVAVGVAATDDGPFAKDELNRVVREANDCLLRDVRKQLKQKMTITGEERSAIRMAAANTCYEYNEKLASFSKPYRDGSKILKEVREAMLAGSIQIADAFITTQLRLSSER